MMQPDGSIIVPLSPLGSASQVDGCQASNLKKARRVRLLLDARTELTNEELEVRPPVCPRLPAYPSSAESARKLSRGSSRAA